MGESPTIGQTGEIFERMGEKEKRGIWDRKGGKGGRKMEKRKEKI